MAALSMIGLSGDFVENSFLRTPYRLSPKSNVRIGCEQSDVSDLHCPGNYPTSSVYSINLIG